MKATLEFSLPEEKTEFDDATHGGDWHEVVQDFLEWIQYQEDTVGLDELRAKVIELVENYGLDVW